MMKQFIYNGLAGVLTEKLKKGVYEVRDGKLTVTVNTRFGNTLLLNAVRLLAPSKHIHVVGGTVIIHTHDDSIHGVKGEHEEDGTTL